MMFTMGYCANMQHRLQELSVATGLEGGLKDSGTHRAWLALMTNSISIEGRITFESSDEMRRKLRAVLRSKPARVTVDLSRATLMDPALQAHNWERCRSKT